MNWLQKTAMFVSGEGDHVIAYKSYIFLIDPMKQDVDDPIVRQMANFLGTPTRELVSTHTDTWEYLSSLRDMRPDILQGTLSDDRHTLTLQSDNFQHGSGSRLLQNVMKTLNIGDVQYQNEEEVYRNMSDWQVTGDLPEFMFHGTSSESADRILRFGLQPGESVTNYPGRGPHHDISHDDIVFLAEDVNRAMYHALTAAGNQNGFPVIFRFKIPDPNLLVPDYDVEVMYDDEFEGNIYQNTYKAPRDKFDTGINEEPYGFSKKIGVMGYRGRIPANFIVDIMIRPEGDLYNYSGDEWISVTAAQLNTAIEIGDPISYGYEPEDEDEDEDEDEEFESYAESNWFQKISQKPMALPKYPPPNVHWEADEGGGGAERIDQVMSPETAEEQFDPAMEYAGHGSFGVVYRTGPGEMSKYTKDPREAETVKLVFDQKYDWIVPILAPPEQVQDDPPVFKIRMKELEPPEKPEMLLISFLNDITVRHRDGFIEKMVSIEEVMEDYVAYLDIDKIVYIYERMQYIFQQNADTLWLTDLHGGNFGWDGNELKVWDVGPDDSK